MTTQPRRRWFRFSLRTVFMVIAIIAVWLGYELQMMRERTLNVPPMKQIAFVEVRNEPDAADGSGNHRYLAAAQYPQFVAALNSAILERDPADWPIWCSVLIVSEDGNGIYITAYRDGNKNVVFSCGRRFFRTTVPFDRFLDYISITPKSEK